jgi:hypothetical protein
MVDMKLLKVITISISLFLFSTQLFAGSLPKEQDENMGDMPNPTWLGNDLKYSMPAFLWRHTQYLGYRLKKEEKMQHQSAVFFMLNNAKNGEIVSWYSDKRLAGGKVRVIHSYPISGGYCRTYQAYIKVKTKSKHTTNNACKYIGSPSWSFYK